MSRIPSRKQRAMLTVLARACEQEGTEEFVYASEWLGWLPYGAYHWVDVGADKSVERGFPEGWGRRDLDALVAAGCLEQLEVVEGRHDPDDLLIRFRITPRARDLARDDPASGGDDTREEAAGGPSSALPPSGAPAHAAGEEKGAGGPARTTIVGTIMAGEGAGPFHYDMATDVLESGFTDLRRCCPEPAAEQLARLESRLRADFGVGLDQTRINELRCYDCGQWFDVARRPGKWSFGMCFSCSMDRSSEIADMD